MIQATICNFPWIMLICLVITVIIECSIAFVMKIRSRDLLIVLLVNVFTNPLLNSIELAAQFLIPIGFLTALEIALEIIIWLVEGFIFKKTIDLKINPFLFSLILNASSYGLGIIISYFLFI